MNIPFVHTSRLLLPVLYLVYLTSMIIVYLVPGNITSMM